MDRALAALAQEYKEAGKRVQFEALKPWLSGDDGKYSQAQAARQLEMSEGAVKVAIHRLRRRLRDVIKNEISHTVKGPRRHRPRDARFIGSLALILAKVI